MQLKIDIEATSKKALLKELVGLTEIIKSELNSPVCTGCTDCKDKRKGCFTGGGSSESGLESDWKLTRNRKEFSKICSSKGRKRDV